MSHLWWWDKIYHSFRGGISSSLSHLPGHIAHLVTYLTTDASLTADPGVMSLISTLSHTFVEIDHESVAR